MFILNKKINSFKKSGGFTLIEMLVVLGAFTFVITISLSSFLAILKAQKKSIATETVQENLRFSLEAMLRDIRTGIFYYCGDTNDDFGNGSNNKDCLNGGPVITFRNPSSKIIIYRLNNETVEKYSSDYTGINCSMTVVPPIIADPNDPDCFLKLTFPEIKIEKLKFYVIGSNLYISGDLQQPRVLISLIGSMGSKETGTFSSFNIQTTVSQRQLDK